jgi:hypothetical protein
MTPIHSNCDMSQKFRYFTIEDEFCVLLFTDIFPPLSTLG